MGEDSSLSTSSIFVSFSLFKFFILSYVYECLPTCTGTFRGHVRCCVGTGNRIQVLCRSSRCSPLLSHYSAPFIVVVYGHPYGCEVLAHCGVWHVPTDSDAGHLFVCSFAICVWFLEQCLFKFFAWFFNYIFYVMLVVKALHVFRICICVRHMIYKNAKDFKANWMLCLCPSRSATISKWASLKFIMRRFMTFWFVKVKTGRENNQ